MPQVSFDQLVAQVASGTALTSFPTDTVPALAARLESASLIFIAKQRRLDKPLILMAAHLTDLWDYVGGTAAERQGWQQMANRHLPGALTMVLPASDRVPPTLNPANPSSIGVRVPNHPVAGAILALTGPLATTSANLSGQPALQTMAEIEAQFPQVLTLAPNDLAELSNSGPTSMASGVPSTVIQWTGIGWTVLRQGAVVID
jgi:L-threonylcarbamoyladenylate synthase